MAKRISELDVATSVSDSDYIPCVQGGVTKRATRAALFPDVPFDTISEDLTLPSLPIGSRKSILADADVTVTMPSGETLDGAATIDLLDGQFVEVLKVSATAWKRTGSNIPDVPVDTSSRILDLTGDRCPAIPDDPAGVTYFQDAWATTDGWASGGAVSVSGGKLIFAKTAASQSLTKTISIAAGRIMTIKVRVSSGAPQQAVLFARVSGTTGETKPIATDGTWNVVTFVITGSVSEQAFYCPTFGSTELYTLEIDWVYIGTGACRSKLVDRAGVPWTNYGVLPVPGPFGKGLQFPGNSYLQAPGPMVGDVWTIAIDLAPSSLAENNHIFTNQPSSLTTGHRYFISQAGDLIGQINDGTTQESTVSSVGFTANSRKRVVITSSGSEIKVYSESVLINTTAITISGLSSTPFFVGTDNQVTKQFFTGTIYAFRADSRVWTDDEIARWSRDPYSEDSGLVDAFSLDFTNLPAFADNAAAIAGNLPAGKLYKTSTGNVLVRY